ncbi:MAG TPA: cation:proton antiporter [Xanthomonadales bacterium]|nr:cation:proton antiporter [Xanthomonadales bacterium]
MTILYILLVLLIVTRIFGEIAVRLRQPALVGELVGGIMLGLVVTQFSRTFPVLAGIPENEVFKAISDLAIFFIMLLGGLEMRPRDLARASSRGIPIALGGIAVPLGLGYAAGFFFIPENPARVAQCLLIGVALAITAVPVTVKVLMDLGQLDSTVGRLIVTAALFDDILSLILLAVLTTLATSGSVPPPLELLWLLAKVMVFFASAYFVGRIILPRLGRNLKELELDYIEISGLLAWALALAVISEAIGMHFVVGAYLAGLVFTRNTVDSKTYEQTMQHVEGMTTGFFAPVFFASIGMHLDLTAILNIPGMLAVILLIAFCGKLLGAGGAARATGMSNRDSIAVGFGMNARGAVELIVADIALRAGLFSQPEPTPAVVRYLYSLIVIVAVVTTVVSPIVLRRFLSQNKPSRKVANTST